MVKQAKDKPKDPWPVVLAAIAALQKGHEVGRAVMKQFGDHAERGKIAIAAQAYGHSVDAVRKLRQFGANYNNNDLKELCDLCREHQRAFGLSFIYRLVAIKNKSKRAAFQRKTISNHWGHDRFVRELRRAFRLGHKRGRKPYLPESVAAALPEIKETRLRFIELLKHSAAVAGQEKGKGKAKRQLQEVCKSLLKALTEKDD